MVSNLPYPSFKGVNLRRKWPAPTLFLIALAFSLITLTPHFLSILAAIYIISAPVTVLTRKVRHKPDAAREPVSTPGDTNGALENSDS